MQVSMTDDLTISVEGRLLAAAQRFELRDDSRSRNHAMICRSMAANLARYGRFASMKQNNFALDLIQWSLPKTPRANVQVAGSDVTLHTTAMATTPEIREQLFPSVASLFGPSRLAKLDFGTIKLSLKNDGSVIWLLMNGDCIGRMDPQTGRVSMFKRATAAQGQELVEQLKRIEADPIGEAKRHGKETGQCCVCSRMLTDPESIDAGIGPIYASKF